MLRVSCVIHGAGGGAGGGDVAWHRSGLGRAIAVHLAALGANVVVACRHSDPAIAEGILADAAASPLRAAANAERESPGG